MPLPKTYIFHHFQLQTCNQNRKKKTLQTFTLTYITLLRKKRKLLSLDAFCHINVLVGCQRNVNQPLGYQYGWSCVCVWEYLWTLVCWYISLSSLEKRRIERQIKNICSFFLGITSTRKRVLSIRHILCEEMPRMVVAVWCEIVCLCVCLWSHMSWILI